MSSSTTPSTSSHSNDLIPSTPTQSVFSPSIPISIGSPVTGLHHSNLLTRIQELTKSNVDG
ncbi:hypothetical protein HMI56_002608 [Coelomomyces lativittatus]|nr:hypothetical protein HMI56_002608 [Coelomomyces lativittatus]